MENYQELEQGTKSLGVNSLAERAVHIACMQLMASYEFKKPRMAKLTRYYELYDGKATKKLRQLFNVPIPVFAGMIDTLNSEYDAPIRLNFKEGDPADYFKVQKINGAWNKEIVSNSQNTKWDEKLRIARQHAIMSGRAIMKYTTESDPEYKSTLDTVNLKNFHFQPRGGLWLENHLFAGEEDITKTKSELLEGGKSGLYDKEQVQKLFDVCAERDYLPDGNQEWGEKLSRFKPLGLDPDSNSYVGETVYRIAQWILNINGKRYFLVFHPWSKTWLRFEKWESMSSSGLYPWVSYATHPDDENFLSKAYSDDLYPSADAIVTMFNQELTNREKRNFGARAYDKDMFTDVRKLDESMHRPDALVPADTKGGTRRISEGIYEFKVGELGGTVNLIDWISGTIGRSTGANDLAMGAVQEVSKKASVTFAEQKNVSKRIGWASQPFQAMMGELGTRYVYGLKDDMPSKMAIRLLGTNGYDWDTITRLDLDTTKPVDVEIINTDKQIQDSELKAKRRETALMALAQSPNVNSKKRDEEMLRSIGGYSDEEIAEFMDTKNWNDKKSTAKASEQIQIIIRGGKPTVWFGATSAFMQKIVDFAVDNRHTLKEKYQILMDYAMSHKDIAMQNMERKAQEDIQTMKTQNVQKMMSGEMPPPEQETSDIPAGVQGAITRGENMAQ